MSPSIYASTSLAILSIAAINVSSVANPINAGNYLVNAGLAQSSPLTGLSGGPYNRFRFTTNWSYSQGSPTSAAAAFNFNAGSFSGIISSLSLVTGMAPNANSTTIVVEGSLSVAISSSTALTFVRGQLNTPTWSEAHWDNTTFTFNYQRRFFQLPTTIAHIGTRGNTNASFSIAPSSGGGGGVNPLSIGLYSDEGFLIASNFGAAGPNDPGVLDLNLPEGRYYSFISGQGTTFSADALFATVPALAPGAMLTGSLGTGSLGGFSFNQGEGTWLSFDIVPTPAATGLLALGIAAITRRRR
jgi:hypothetical protein